VDVEKAFDSGVWSPVAADPRDQSARPPRHLVSQWDLAKSCAGLMDIGQFIIDNIRLINVWD